MTKPEQDPEITPPDEPLPLPQATNEVREVEEGHIDIHVDWTGTNQQ